MTARQKVDIMIKTARHAAAARRTLQKQASMSFGERLQLAGYGMIPSFATDFKGRLLINSYLNKAKYRKGGGGSVPSTFEENIINTPGSAQAVYQYLNGAGRSKVPRLVDAELKGKWYRLPAKLLSRTTFGRDYVIDKVMDRMLPKVNGSTDVAKMFLAAGGNV